MLRLRISGFNVLVIHNGTMRPYQLDGLNWMIGLYDNGISGILADEMGLGKTLQTLAFLAYLKVDLSRWLLSSLLQNVRGLNKAHVIIVPKSTLPNWLKEIKKWTPSLTAFGLLGTKEDRVPLLIHPPSVFSEDVVGRDSGKMVS